MAIISKAMGDYAKLYSGYDDNRAKLGAGLLHPSIYKTPNYEKSKIDHIVVGGVSDCIYGSFITDPQPLILALGLESQYNTIIGLNLRYVPSEVRRGILKLVLDSNQARIISNQPLIVDWRMLAKAFPQFVPFITRRYKQQLLRVNNQTGKGVVPLLEWPELVNINSPFENQFAARKKS